MKTTFPKQTLLQGARYVPAVSTDIRERFATEFSKQREAQEWDKWVKQIGCEWPPKRDKDEYVPF